MKRLLLLLLLPSLLIPVYPQGVIIIHHRQSGGPPACSELDCLSTPLDFWWKGYASAEADNHQTTSIADSSGNNRSLSTSFSTDLVFHTNIANGQPGWQLTGNNNAITINTGWSPGASFTIIAAIKITGSTGYRSIVGGSSGAVQYRIDDTSNKQTVNKAAVANVGTSTTGITVSSAQIVAVTYDGATIKFYLNGALDTTASSSVTFSSTTTVMGYSTGGEGFIGYILEVGGYPSVLSAGDMTIAKNRLCSHYGVTCS